MTKVNIGVLVFLLGCVILLGIAVRKQRNQIDAMLRAGYQPPEKAGEEEFIYVDLMHPWVTSDHPGTCPICGMELVKVTGEEARRMQEAVKAGVVQVSAPPVKRVLANVELTNVQELSWREEFPVLGSVVTPSDALSNLASWVEGRIDKLYVERVGDFVKKGQKLMEIYSPTLVQAQEEFLTAIRTKERMDTAGYEDLTKNTEALIASSARKLKLLGMTEEQINKLAQTGKVVDSVPVYARESGIVMELMAREGMYVMDGESVLELANLDPIWVEMEIFQEDASRVTVGDEVEFHPVGESGRVYSGRVFEFVPMLTMEKRTLLARARVTNPGYRLRPGMFVDGKIIKSGEEKVLIIPRNAVLVTGKGARAWVPSPGISDQFEPREIQIGRILGKNREFYEVKSGLRAGQTVVMGAVFLLDSEAQLLQASAGVSMDTSTENDSDLQSQPGDGGHVHK